MNEEMLELLIKDDSNEIYYTGIDSNGEMRHITAMDILLGKIERPTPDEVKLIFHDGSHVMISQHKKGKNK